MLFNCHQLEVIDQFDELLWRGSCCVYQMGIIDFSLYLHDTPLLQAKTPMEMRWVKLVALQKL